MRLWMTSNILTALRMLIENHISQELTSYLTLEFVQMIMCLIKNLGSMLMPTLLSILEKIPTGSMSQKNVLSGTQMERKEHMRS